MPPVHDPRFSSARKQQTYQQEQLEAQRLGRWEYHKPLIMLGAGVAGCIAIAAFQGREVGAGAVALSFAAVYPLILAVELAFGIIGLWLAAKIWLGGVGYLTLAILRLAGIYALTDAIALLLEPLLLVGWLIRIAIYLGLLAWLFELEIQDSIFVGLITWFVKIAAGIGIGIALSGL